MPRLNHNHKIFNNHHHYHHNSSLSIFPNEILSLIFSNLDIGDLLMVCSVSKRFKEIGTLCFVKRLKEKSPATFNKNSNNCIGLLLSFEQEHRLTYNLEFEFESYDELSGNFKFKPKPTSNSNKKTIRFIQSSMVKNPSLYRVVLFGCSKLNLKRHHHNNNVTPTPNSHITNMATPRLTGLNRVNQTPHNNNNNHIDHQHDFLSKSMSMPIKSQNERFTKTQYVYRMGDGINHLKVPYKFTYSISETPPPFMVKTRSGERWIVPESFECPLGFFYPNEPATHQMIMMAMMALSYLKMKNHRYNHHNHHHNNYHHNHNNNINHNNNNREVLIDISNINHNEKVDNSNNYNSDILQQQQQRNSTISLELDIDLEDEEMIRQARLRNEMSREYLLKMKKLIMSPLESTRRTRGAR